jgi:uncharacterized coiled-coil protein SlyX
MDAITKLEERITHQELAIEELTKSHVNQEKLIRKMNNDIKSLMSLVKEALPSQNAPESDEIPPHY